MSAITDELRRLGKLTPDQIAADLRERGIKGRMGSCTECPLARRLNQCGARGASVGHCTIFEVKRLGATLEPLPSSAIKFTFAFDNRQYPDLVEA